MVHIKKKKHNETSDVSNCNSQATATYFKDVFFSCRNRIRSLRNRVNTSCARVIRCSKLSVLQSDKCSMCLCAQLLSCVRLFAT